MKILGYASDTAEDGDEAFRLWQSRRFAVVITDCEMPGMDGYELARSIRRAEAAGGDHHTPVIACTAHAMAGEAEKCMQAGMDDCLVKPIDLTRLQQKLRQWLPLPQDSADAAPAYRPAPHGGTQAVDLALVRETWGDREETLREIFTLFQRTNDEDARTLLQAVQERDLAKAARASHRMLGSSRMVGAYDFAAVCERIHSCTQAAAWDVVQTAMHEFAAELARLNACIGSLAGSREEGEEAGRTRPGFRS